MIKKKSNNQLIFDFIMLALEINYSWTNRGQKLKKAKLEKIGKELVKRELLTIEQVETILYL